MDDALRDRLGVLLEQASALSPDERPRFIEAACGADTGMREELGALLAALESSSGYFEELAERVVAVLGASAEPSAGNVAIGETVSHYEILEWVGAGGMGVVYRARDLRLGRFVALKFLPRELTTNDSARARLVAEAKAASALDHPNIGVVHDIEETEAGGLFIAMAWYPGETLQQKLQRGPFPLQEVLELARQIAGALAAAHGAGIVHRDVKPSNILITPEGVTRLLDFGIAKVAGTDLTGDGATPGTVAYMSPEQTRGEASDPRTDIWSLGVVLYEVLAGQRPFRGGHDQAVVYSIRNDEPEPIARLRPEAPPGADHIVRTCLAKDPARRYPGADEFLADLRAVADEVSGRRRILPSSLRRRLIASAAVGAVGLLAVSGYLLGARPGPPGMNAHRVVVAPFENRTGQPSLDPVGRMAADWIIQGLSHTGLVEVVPMTAALTASRFVIGSPRGSDAAGRAQLLADETGAGIVVSGTYYQVGDSLYLQATLMDAGRDRILRALEPIATPSELPVAGIEQLRQRLMSVLAAHVNPRMHDHAVKTGSAPPSFEAYRAHAEGLELFSAGDWRGAVARFVEASSHDSSFMAPLLFSSLAFINLGNLAAVDSVLLLAAPYQHLLFEGDRLAFEYVRAVARGDRAAAYRATVRNPALAPGGLAHWGLAAAALGNNRPRETVRVSRQLDPERGELRGWFLYWRDLARAHHRLGEHREELRVARRARKLFPNEPQPVLLEVLALAALRRERALNALLAEQTPVHPNAAWLLRQAGLELLAHGASTAGEALLRRSLERHLVIRSDEFGWRVFLAQAHSLLGERDEAEGLLHELAAERPDLMGVQGAIGTAAAARRDVAEAARISAWLSDLDGPYLHGGNTYWRARIAAGMGEPERAIELLRRSVQEGMLLWDLLHTEPDFATLRGHPSFRELIRPKG